MNYPEANDGTDPVSVGDLTVSDFDRRYRFRMVQAYPFISGVEDVYEATHDEIDAGFAKCLLSGALRRTHDIYLAEHVSSRAGDS
jgi:hypothetical protein